jgi:hypothetical protein
MKMKNIFLLLIIASFFASCATQRSFDKKTMENLNLDNITKAQCKAENMWSVPVMGISTTMVVYENCVGVNKLTMIVVDSANTTKELDSATADLINMRYIHYLNYRSEGTKTWTAEKIKTEVITAEKSPTGRSAHVNYYSISSAEVE